MPVLTLLALSLALAMDAFAVALATGMRLEHVNLGHIVRMAGIFGFFQFAMPVLGWLAGSRVHRFIGAWDHWLAFGLLAFVGGRMLKEAWDNRDKSSGECTYTDNTRGRTILLLAVAVSVDALAVGLSLAFLDMGIWIPAIVIGLVCFAVTVAGLVGGRLICLFGSRFGNLGNWANALGGAVLFAIGFGILHDHGALFPLFGG